MPIDKDTGATIETADIINDILPFCSAGVDGRDLLAQADYAADVQRTIGHQPGIARQELANKQARQVSHMAAGLAQFLARRYAAGVKDDGDLDKVEAGIVAALYAVIGPSLPGLAKVGTPGIVMPDGTTITVDATGKISAAKVSQYELGEVYYFRHPTLRPGFQPCQGGIITDAATQYPDIWAYLQTAEGQLLLKTEAQWQAMTTATWATLADGTTVGWGGIGGAPYFVQDLGVGTLRMPDLRGMYAEAAGFDSLGVGGVDGDQGREIAGEVGKIMFSGYAESGALTITSKGSVSHAGGSNTGLATIAISSGRTTPTGPAFAPRRWGALACCYLGAPAS